MHSIMLLSPGIQLIPVRLFHACCLPLSGRPAVLSPSLNNNKKRGLFVGLLPLFIFRETKPPSHLPGWFPFKPLGRSQVWVPTASSVLSRSACLVPLSFPDHKTRSLSKPVLCRFCTCSYYNQFAFLVYRHDSSVFVGICAAMFAATAALQRATPPRPFASPPAVLRFTAGNIVLDAGSRERYNTNALPFGKKRQEKNVSRRRMNAMGRGGCFVLLFLLCFGTAEWQRFAYDNIIIQAFCLCFKDVRLCSPSPPCFAMAFFPPGCFRLGQHVLQLSLRICTARYPILQKKKSRAI